MATEKSADSTKNEEPTSTKIAHPWWALVALLIGVSMIVIDGSLVNVLLPDMVDDLSLNATETQWVNSIYALVFAALLITIGLLADRFGRRLLFLSGVVIFALGSLASGVAQDPSFLIAARAVQAIGGAMMLPSSIAVINVLFTGRNRAVAFGLWGAIFAGAAAIGPLLGGFLAEYFSWRWAFLINIPIGLISAIMVLRFVPENKGPKVAGLDPVGVILSASGLGLIVYALIEGQQFGWWTAIAEFDLGPITIPVGGLSVVPIALVTGCVLLLLLVTWEKRRSELGKASLLDLSLFRIRRYGFGNIVALVVSLGEFGVLFVLPLWIQSVHGLNPLETGAILAFLAVGAIVSGGLARKASALLGPTRVVRLGMVLEVVGIVWVGLTLGVDRNPWLLAIPLVVYGLGVGFASAQLTNVVLADVPPIKSGQASAVTSTFRQVGTALGSAVIGAVLFTGLGTILDKTLAEEAGITDEQRQKIVDEVQGSAGQAIRGLEEIPGLTVVVKDAKESYTEAARNAAWVAGGLVFFGLLVSFALPRDRKEDYEGKQEATSDA
ncbi:MAG: DHA2 family efflux MFS transporter permease subunit [Actinomycetia bacterium]|nr:DHA2 family efflux MFS transporter permease subunit [Actinomycetes bacterium]MCH9801608.1 DHA2 family efflux MFS transporter permease subunit [Actinomycetes bacterium]